MPSEVLRTAVLKTKVPFAALPLRIGMLLGLGLRAFRCEREGRLGFDVLWNFACWGRLACLGYVPDFVDEGTAVEVALGTAVIHGLVQKRGDDHEYSRRIVGFPYTVT